MNKLMLLIYALVISFTAYEQQVYNWVNDQYDAGDWGDGGGVFYRNSYNGKVKRVDFFIHEFQLDTTYIYSSTFYDKQGRVKRYITYSSDTDSSVYSFNYNPTEDSVQVDYNEQSFQGAEESNRNYIAITKSILAPPVPDSTQKDDEGRVIAYWYNKDATYTFYDEFGRKVMDSVPDGMSWQHSMFYRYEENKVISTYVDEHEKIIMVYQVDDIGNWTRSYCEFPNELLKSEMIQKIVYYPEDKIIFD